MMTPAAMALRVMIIWWNEQTSTKAIKADGTHKYFQFDRIRIKTSRGNSFLDFFEEMVFTGKIVELKASTKKLKIKIKKCQESNGRINNTTPWLPEATVDNIAVVQTRVCRIIDGVFDWSPGTIAWCSDAPAESTREDSLVAKSRRTEAGTEI